MDRLLRAAGSGLAWSLERAVRLAVFVGIVWVLSRFAPGEEPSPLLADATVRDLGMALVVPAFLVIFFAHVMGDSK